MLEPASVALKFGFLAVLYLFLLWVARSALKDLRGDRRDAVHEPAPADATAMHAASAGLLGDDGDQQPWLRVEQAPGLRPGVAYDLSGGVTLGRGDSADIRFDDPFASTRHARISPEGGVVVLEDLGSTNGTYLNGEALRGPQPLHPGDRIRIGDSEFVYRQ